MYDVIVIGGGPSGLMAAIAAGEKKKKVLLLDKGDKLGKKLAISGGGRCNVTNRLPINELIEHIPGNGRFLYSALSIFSNEDIIKFFENLGVHLKEEDHGRMFPISNDAQSVVDSLLKQLAKLHVEIRVNSPVRNVSYKDGQVTGVNLQTGESILAQNVIIAVGGKSVPHTGSTGDGYAWAKAAGHTITNLFPTEVPITSEEDFIKKKVLQGLSLRDVALSVYNPKGKIIKTHRMDMLFTHFGISGPAVLRSSQFVVKALDKFEVSELMMGIDIFPDYSVEEIKQSITKMMENDPKRAIKNVLKGFIPERYLYFLIDRAGIDSQITYTNITKENILYLAEMMKKFTFKVNGTLPIEKAFVTGGGVSVKEINPKEMSSKKMKGLYFCGEILDIHGYTGGFNITAALVTGRIAGINAAKNGM